MYRVFKILIEKHPDGYIAYPVGLKGSVSGFGKTSEEAVCEVNQAIMARIRTFGEEIFDLDSPILDASLTDIGITY